MHAVITWLDVSPLDTHRARTPPINGLCRRA